MATRRASTTSLAQYARPGANSPSQNPHMDFCNAFWGIADGGVDVLFARLRGAMRTVDELRNFWKERSAIEEEYSKRLSKLAKMTLGRDEIGEMRAALDSIRLETDRQAGYHHELAQTIRNDLEAPTAAFYNRQSDMKKNYQASVEREYKSKQTQESYVNKSREKYEQDCMRINSYTAQATLVQGKDLDKIRMKLERAQSTVGQNERDFAGFTKVYAEMSQKWEKVWKEFCDRAQDQEEERLEYIKDNLWAYANAISTVCVSDDESCEVWRVNLEQIDLERDTENFVRDYGTGNLIPDPPDFINYTSPDAIPSSSSRTTNHIAHFTRVSRRDRKHTQNAPPTDEEPVGNAAGIGAGGGGPANGRGAWENTAQPDLTRQPSRAASSAGNSSHKPNGSVNGYTPPSVAAGSSSSTAASVVAAGPGPSSVARKPTISAARSSQQYRNQPPVNDPHAETINPNAETFIKVGGNAYKVDLSKDPQRGSGPPRSMSPTKASNAGLIDPLAQQLEELKSVVSATGTVRRGSTWKSQSVDLNSNTNVNKPGPSRRGTIDMGGAGSSASISPRPGTSPGPGPSASSPIGGGPPSAGLGAPHAPTPVRDYRNSAEMVVGAHPSVSRPSSPSPAAPTAAFMVPKPVSPSGSDLVEGVLRDYNQSLPGEKKVLSRRGSYVGISPAPDHRQQGSSLSRPPSIGHAGIGAHGSRSNSPQPMSRGPSPAPSHHRSPSPGPGSLITVPSGGGSLSRAASPNSVGIAIDPSGRVLHDAMAQKFQQQQQRPQSAQQPQGYMHPQASPQRMTYTPSPTQVQQQQPRYGASPAPNVYQQPPPTAQPTYAIPPPPPLQQPSYHTPPPPQQQQQPQYAQPMYQQPPSQTPAPQQGYNDGSMGRAQSASMSGSYYGNGVATPAPAQQPPQQQGGRVGQYHHPQQSSVGYSAPAPQHLQQAPPPQQATYREPAAVRRSPSPQPPPIPTTGQSTEDGAPILFYVQALYDYTATIEEEFDFQAGDIIAVTSTPEDGWWSGHLLDDSRRQRNRNIFPSNFVSLF